MNTFKIIEDPCAIDLHYARVQSGFLSLHLQLAGEFETTYKTESGKEIEVTRSADGKFASKGGGGSSSSDSESKDKTGQAAKTVNTAKLAKDLLSGEKGTQVKDALVATASDPDVKTGIRKASFAEILGGAGDAISNTADYITKKLKQAKTAASKQSMGAIVGEVFVGCAVMASIAGTTAVVAGASAPIALGVAVAVNYLGLKVGDAVVAEKFKRQEAERLKKVQDLITSIQMDKSFQKLKEERDERLNLYKKVEKAVDRQLDEAAARTAI